MQACPDRLMARGGSWVLDPSVMLGYNASADPAHTAQPTEYHKWHAAWQPLDCRLQLHDPAEVTKAFAGKHFLIIGDSITHMLMASMMELILGKDRFRYPSNGHELCGHNNRVYDSGDMLWPMRFSFLWAGSAHYCDNDKGLPHLLDEKGESLERFKRGLGNDVDYVVMNVGAHDIAGNVPLEEYGRLLSSVFDMVLNASAPVRAQPQRLLWRSTTAHVYTVGDWNAGIHWMNWLAERDARRRGFGVLDSHQLWAADTELRRANGFPSPSEVFCGDGIHGRYHRNVGTEDRPKWAALYCDKVYAEAALTAPLYAADAEGGFGSRGRDGCRQIRIKGEQASQRDQSTKRIDSGARVIDAWGEIEQSYDFGWILEVGLRRGNLARGSILQVRF